MPTTGAAAGSRWAKCRPTSCKQACGGVADWAIPMALNRMLIEEPWDLVINVGHVVPHEVLGFANHNKNYFIGLGGKETSAPRTCWPPPAASKTTWATW